MFKEKFRMQKEKAQATVSRDIKENQREGVSIDGE